VNPFTLARTDERAPEPVWSNAVGRVLVVDGERRQREFLTDILESRGYSVHPVADGSTALARVEEAAPHAVVLGVTLSPTTGFELCRTIKADPNLGHVPVLMVASRPDRPERLEGLQAGADDILYTPIDRLEVLLRVRHAVQRSRRYAEVGRNGTRP